MNLALKSLNPNPSTHRPSARCATHHIVLIRVTCYQFLENHFVLTVHYIQESAAINRFLSVSTIRRGASERFPFYLAKILR
uniref:MIP27105p n=1 Tax=Drosophila melanogaster TaxID=7227 RepID=F3YDJ6_DROME|nr:MIP27105p [Drosophila melanogaster]